MKNYFAAISLCWVICFAALEILAADAATKRFITFRKFLEDKDKADFYLVSAIDSSIYPCHRAILASKNAFWESMVYNRMKESVENSVCLHYSGPTLKIFRDLTYDPNKNRLTEQISLQVYMELIDLADQSFDDDLKNILKHVPLGTIEEGDIAATLEFAVLHKDQKLIDKVLDTIKDWAAEAKFADPIIRNIKENDDFFIAAFKKIRFFNLFKDLSKTNHNLFIGAKLGIDLKVEHLLAMDRWSIEEANKYSQFDIYNLAKEKLLQNVESLMIAKAQELSGLVEIISFFLTYYKLYISVLAENFVDIDLCNARNAMWDAANNKNIEACFKTDFISWCEARDNILAEWNKVRYNLNSLHPQNNIILSRLRSLFLLAYVATNQEKYFWLTYGPSFKQASGCLDISKEKTIEIIANKTWNRPELADNPFIKPLEAIVKAVVHY